MLKKKKHDDAFFSPFDLIIMAITALLVVGADVFFKVPFDVQGEAGILSTAFIVVAIGLIRRPGSATIIAFVAGLIASVVDPSRWGLLYTIVTYTAIGAGIDIALLLMGDIRHVFTAVLASAIGNLLHFMVKWIYGVMVGVPVSVIASAIPMTAIQHLIFGLLGGLIGFILLYSLDRISGYQSTPIVEQG